MDFTYRARAPQLDEDDLAELDADLAEFHQHKKIFESKGVFNSKYGFNGIAKLHILRHYPHLTREMGTPDNYSTEGPERLHIDYVKQPYARTNGVDPEPQMTVRLQQQDAWDFLRHELEAEGVIEKRRRRARPEEEPIDVEYTDGSEVEDPEEDSDEIDSDGEIEDSGKGHSGGLWVASVRDGQALEHAKEREIYQFRPSLYIAKEPTFPKVLGSDIIRRHHAPSFIDTVTDYVRQFDQNPAFHLDEHAIFGVWSRYSLHHPFLPFAPLVGRNVDLVRASPAIHNSRGRVTQQAFFDTVLIDEFPHLNGLLRYRAARVRVIFRLPRFCHHHFPDPLAFVELFNMFNPAISPLHRLTTVDPLIRCGQR
ncbi:hypothetical protein FRC06_006036, partial [Ceratobasidium sp. 370]